MVRVLIVDDQEPFRMAARMVVDATDGFEVAGESETGEDSVEKARELDRLIDYCRTAGVGP